MNDNSMNIVSKTFNDLLPIVNKQFQITVSDLSEPYHQNLAQITATFNKAGTLGSGNYINAVLDERCNQLKKIVTAAIDSVFAAMDAGKQIVSDKNLNEIKNSIFQIVERQFLILCKVDGPALNTINQMPTGADIWNKKLYAAFDQEKARIELRLDKALLANTSQHSPSSIHNHVVNPSVGFRDLLHENVIRNALHHYQNGHYRDAVFNAIVGVFDLLRTKSGSGLDGDKLATHVFSLKNPILAIADLTAESGENEQKGFMAMLQGAFLGIRNPKAHTLESDLDNVTAAQYLVFISMLARRIEQAKVLNIPVVNALA